LGLIRCKERKRERARRRRRRRGRRRRMRWRRRRRRRKNGKQLKQIALRQWSFSRHLASAQLTAPISASFSRINYNSKLGKKI